MQQQLESKQLTSLDGFGDDAFNCHTVTDKNYNTNRTRNIISSSFIKGTHLDIKHNTSSSLLPSMSNTMPRSPAFCRSSSSSSSSSSESGSTNSSTMTSSSSPTIGVNLRVTGQCSQGGRKYMEDYFSVAYQQSENSTDLEYAFIGIYDGHGGAEAATFAKEHLMMEIINQKSFWSDYDQDVLRAIREGYIATHYAMWREQEKWPKTANGLLSTAGTTATVAFIRREKIYIGHVGDSGIVLGYQNKNENFWRSKQLTTDHKPESTAERRRINRAGGKVGVKSGVPRVVWNRPRTSCHRGPIRQNTPVDEIPFLAVARSLGDLWSYNAAANEFVVSPDPDVQVIKINPQTFRCLIFGTDGLWNVVTPQEAVDTVFNKESLNERLHAQRQNTTRDATDSQSGDGSQWTNPSKGLVEQALKTWSSKKMRADNTSVVTVILYPPNVNTIETATTTNNITRKTCELGNYTDVDDNDFSIPLMDQTSFQELAEKYLPPESFRNIIYNNIADDYEANINNYHNINNNINNQQQHEEHIYWQRQQQQQQEHHQQQLHNDQNITWEEKISMIYADILAPDANESNGDAGVILHNATATNVIENARKVEKSLESFNDMLKPLTPYGNYTPTEVLPIIPTTATTSSSAAACLTTVEAKLNENSTCNNDLYINGFAETYNSLLDAHILSELNEKTSTITTPINQKHQEQQPEITSEVVGTTVNANVATAASTTTTTPILAGLPMQEILQEQQMYQQQCMSGADGYLLTKLETRREQQRCGGIQTFKVFDGFSATPTAESASNDMEYVKTTATTQLTSSSTSSAVAAVSHEHWHNFHHYQTEHSALHEQQVQSQQQETLPINKHFKLQQQIADEVVAARLIELNSLLQQEHAEEQQVALEQRLKLQQQQQQLQQEALQPVKVLPEEQCAISISNLKLSNTPESVDQEEIPAVEDVLMANTEDDGVVVVEVRREEGITAEDGDETELIEEFLLDDEDRLDETVQINEISSSSTLTENLLEGYESPMNVKKIATPTLFIEKIEKIEILHDKPELVIETMPTSTLHRKHITTNKAIKTSSSAKHSSTEKNLTKMIKSSTSASTCSPHNKNNNNNNNKNKNDILIRKAMKSPYYMPFSVPTRSRSHALNVANKNNNNNNVNVAAKSMIQRKNLRITKQQYPNIPNENQRQSTAVNLRSSGCNVAVIKRRNVVTVTNNKNHNNNIKERRQLRSGNNSNNNAQINKNNNNDSNKNVTRKVNLTIVKTNGSNIISNINSNTNNSSSSSSSKNNCNKNDNVDYYSKRTLRTRNSLSKDMKAKATAVGIGSSSVVGGGANNQLNKNNALKRGINSVTTQLLRSNVAGAGAISASGQRDNFINTHVINLRSRQVASNAVNSASVVTRKVRNLRSNPTNLGVILTNGNTTTATTTINNKLTDVNYGKTTTTTTTTSSTRLQIIGSNHQLATTPPSAKLFRTASASAVAAAMATTRVQRTAALAATAVFGRRTAQRLSSNSTNSTTTTTTATTNNNINMHNPITNAKNATMSTINNKRINATSIAFSNVNLQSVRSGRVTKRLRR